MLQLPAEFRMQLQCLTVVVTKPKAKEYFGTTAISLFEILQEYYL